MNKIQKRTLRLVYEMEDANFENLLLKDSSWMGLNYLLICIFQLITYVCYFHEHSTSRSSKFASSISYTRRRVSFCILFI